MMLSINIGELLSHRAFIMPDVEGYIGRKRYTFKEMNERANKFAHYLKEKNLKKGDRVALLAKNNEDFITVFFAAVKLGIITVPINWRLKPNEITYILSNSQPSLLIYDDVFEKVIEQVKEDFPIDTLQSGNDNFDNVFNSFSTEEPTLEAEGDDTALIMYTSGTTGKPKGAMITHTNLLAASIGMSHVIDWWAGDRFLSVAPFFHIGGFAPIITNVHNGSTAVLMPDFDPVAVWQTIEKERITTMMTIPAMLQFMFKVFDKVKPDYSSLRNVTCGASPVPPTLIEAYDALNIPVQQVYGITEYSGAVSFWKKTMDETKIKSMGKTVFHGKVEIVNPETGEKLGANQVGEIVCHGPQVFKGYWRNKKETEKVLSNRIYRTGDLGMVDKDGFLYVVDRLKDMIISGGENIYSTELENVIRTLPGVADVAVVGKPDKKWGEIPKAYVVLHEDGSITEEEVIQVTRNNLASYKVVKEVEFIKELPRNATGKVLKHKLVD